MATKKESRPSRGRQSGARSRQCKAASKKTTRKPTPRQLMLRDAARSGLTPADCNKLGFKAITPAQNAKMTGKHNNVPGFVIPYFTIEGKPIKNGWRRRNLETPTGRLGGKIENPEKWRYRGPNDELPHLYFPRNFGNWAAQAKDVTEPIYITEGEKKAACMCRFGYAAIALPGVWGWKSKDKGVRIIDDFKQVDWGDADKPRPVYMVFDNDVIIKPVVLGALNALSGELVGMGSEIFIKHLPAGPLKGADDFLVAKGADTFDALPETPFAGSEALWKFSERCAFIEKYAFVYDLKTRRNYDSINKLSFAFADLIHHVPKADGKGTKPVKTAEAWHEWPFKNKVYDLVYEPGQDQVLPNAINTWPGWGCEPVKGDVNPFLELVAFVFEGEDLLQAWFWQWLAYPLQFPGTKLSQAVLLHSLTHGVGKSFIGEVVGEIYGENFNIVGQRELHSAFNGWLVSRQFIMGEEITGSNSRADADQVKNSITRQQFTVNEKHQRNYTQRDSTNYIYTSNRPDAITMEDDDRRIAVHECKSPAKPPSFYSRVSLWRKNAGASHLFHYLLHDVDVSAFDPKARAPMLVAKQQMIDLSKSDLDLFARDILDNPDEVLRNGQEILTQELYTARALRRIASDRCDRHVSRIAASKALRRAGIEQRKVKSKGRSIKLWPLRNPDAWANRPSKEWSAHFEKNEKIQKFAISGRGAH